MSSSQRLRKLRRFTVGRETTALQGGGSGPAAPALHNDTIALAGTVVNEQAMALIDDEIRQNGIISSLLQKISRRVFMGGIQFQMRIGTRTIEVAEETERFIERFWLPEVEHMLLNIQKYGFTVVVYAPHQLADGRIVVIPKVPMEGTYTVRFHVNEHGVPSYTVYRKHRVVRPDGSLGPGNNTNSSNRGGGGGSSGQRSAARTGTARDGSTGAGNNVQSALMFGDNTGGEPTPWENAHVFEVKRFRPSLDGQLNSIVSKTLRYMTSLNRAWENYNQATFEMSRPPYIHTKAQSKGGDKREAGPDDIPFGESDAALDNEGERNRLNDSDRAQLNRARQMAAASNIAQVAQGYDADLQMPVRQRVVPPWESRKYDLPEGFQLSSSVPTAQVPNSFVAVHNELITLISNILEISADIGRGSAKKFASNADFAQRQFNDLIESYQDMIKPIAEEMFHTIYSHDRLEFLESMIEIIEEVESTQLNDNQLQQLAENVQVELVFNNVPDVTLDVLKRLFEDNIIPHEEYKKQALRLFGICEDDCETGTFARDLRRQEESRQERRAARQQERAGANAQLPGTNDPNAPPGQQRQQRQPPGGDQQQREESRKRRQLPGAGGDQQDGSGAASANSRRGNRNQTATVRATAYGGGQFEGEGADYENEQDDVCTKRVRTIVDGAAEIFRRYNRSASSMHQQLEKYSSMLHLQPRALQSALPALQPAEVMQFTQTQTVADDDEEEEQKQQRDAALDNDPNSSSTESPKEENEKKVATPTKTSRELAGSGAQIPEVRVEDR